MIARSSLPGIALLAIGAIQVLAAGLILFLGPPGAEATDGLPDSLFFAVALVNAAVAIPLLWGGRENRRAWFLGATFLCAASAFSLRPIAHLAQAPPSAARLMGALAAINIETFAPYCVWRFALEFPQVTRYDGRRRLAARLAALSLGVGAVLLAVGLLSYGSTGDPIRSPDHGVLRILSRDGSVYWPILLLLITLAFGHALSKARDAAVEERRRVVWLLVGIGVGLAPVLVVNGLIWLVPAFAAFAREPGALRQIGLFAYPGILVSPAIIAYSVLVKHALEIKVVARKAIQYAMARYTIAALAALPFLGLLVFLYLNRARTLTEVFSGWNAIVLTVASLVGGASLLTRRALARAIDRVFFREQYDATQILAGLVERSRRIADPAELGAVMVREIERALHPRTTSLLIRDPRTDVFVAATGPARPLPAAARLIRQFGEAAGPLVVDWDGSESPVHLLPPDEAVWLGDCGFRIVIPIVAAGGEVTGLLALGDRLSELPYSAEDRELLSAIAASAGLAIENRILRTGLGFAAGPAPESARECPACGKIVRQDQSTCPACGSATAPAPVPLVLGGKYEVIERVGSGGMGVVYRGRDLALERQVAIKTLPWISPQHSQRLRREARAMASLSHPNLALIFAAESWHGTPLLVLEYLDGGTLADRLGRGPLSLGQTVALGLVLAGVGQYIHDRGVLHRDIKPSNIGYTATGQPKLLDFGVARILEAARPRGRRQAPGGAYPAVPPAGEATAVTSDRSTANTAEGEIVGTVLYLSPEAIEGGVPRPSFDLWSIAMVLYESLAGAHPFAGETPVVVFSRITRGEIPDIRKFAPAVPEAVAEFFAGVLAADPRARPSTAADLQRRLELLPRH